MVLKSKLDKKTRYSYLPRSIPTQYPLNGMLSNIPSTTQTHTTTHKSSCLLVLAGLWCVAD